MSKPDCPFILWIDLETTGTDEHNDQIIEIGAVITDLDFVEVQAFASPVQPSKQVKVEKLDQVVQEMHEANGLWEALFERREGDVMWIVEHDLIEWLDWVWPPGNGRIALGGSGVSHFDRRFIALQMPRLAKRISYWSYDVGVVRRFGRLAGIPAPSVTSDSKTHRALEDIRLHIEEARYYRDLFEQLGVKDAEQE